MIEEWFVSKVHVSNQYNIGEDNYIDDKKVSSTEHRLQKSMLRTWVRFFVC